jgi:hypothetical protein
MPINHSLSSANYGPAMLVYGLFYTTKPACFEPSILFYTKSSLLLIWHNARPVLYFTKV